MLRAAALASVVFICACGNGRLVGVSGGWTLQPGEVTFVPTYVGAERTSEVTLHSQTARTQAVQLSVSGPFELRTALDSLPGGSAQALALVYLPTAAGPDEGELTVTVEGVARTVALHALGLAPLECAPTGSACVSVHFDPSTGACVTATAPNGASCAPLDQCVVGGTCADGVCVGQPNSCDDHDLCTLDSCGAEAGCSHQEISFKCPAPADPCKVPSCDPLTGCAVTDAPDGTSCGPLDCNFASVCIGGSCQQRPVPEGAACGEVSPCRAPGTCQSHLCIQAPALPLVEAWTYQPRQLRVMAFEGLTDPGDQLYWLECDDLPINSIQSSCEAISHTRDNLERFRTKLVSARTQPIAKTANRQLLSGPHFVFEAYSNEVTSVSTLTGAQEWTRTLDAQVLVGPHDTSNEFQINGFVADAAGNLTLAVRRWERQPGSVTELENALIVLDAATGAVKRTQFLVGAILSLALEPSGNLYLSLFNGPSSNITALGPSGATRWTVTNNFELVRAQWNGELLLQSGEVYSTVDGAKLPGSHHYTGSLLLPLMATGHRYEFTGLCCDTCDCPFVDTSVIRGSVSGQDAPVFTRPMSTGYVAATDGRITDRGDALYAIGSPGSVDASLHAITSAGDERFSCAVPDPAGINPPGFSRSWDSVTLVKDLWVVRRTYECNFCEFGEAPMLTAFKVPGLAPATNGWVGRSGGPMGNLGGW